EGQRGVECWNNLDQGLALGVDHAEDGASWLAAGREIVASVARVEPDFVVSGHSRHLLVDAARSGVQDDRYGRRGVRICRAPRLTGRIENHAASKEQVLVRTEGEPGRLAERHGKQGLQRPVRIDSRNGPARRVPIYFGDRDVEPVP